MQFSEDFLRDDIMSSLNVVVRVDGICCLLSVAIDLSVEPNRTGKRNQVTQQEIVA